MARLAREYGEAYAIPLSIARPLIKNNIANKTNLPAPSIAVACLLQNALQSLDEYTFNAPAISSSPNKRSRRSAANAAHRKCVRINFDKTNGVLSITDYGVGMTRADLINCLGVGGEKVALAPVVPQTENDFDDEDDSTFSQPGGGIDISPEALGGFYSALASIGSSVQVGTKSKYDEYYTFEVGPRFDEVESVEEERTMDKFYISKDLPEGTLPSIHNGFEAFSAVTGEAGTRVSIKLTPPALLDPLFSTPSSLQSLVETIFDSSDYNYIFGDSEEASKIDERVRELRGKFQQQESKNDDNNSKNNSNSANGEETNFYLDDQFGEQFSSSSAEEEENDDDDGLEDRMNQNDTFGDSTPALLPHMTVSHRSKFIPLRLSLNERKMFRLVEAAITCTDYTSTVDSSGLKDSKRQHMKLKGISNVLLGLVLACDNGNGRDCAEEGLDGFKANGKAIQTMFEIARRHKVMNPEKMRSEYGKLLYLIQDAVSPTIKPELGFSVKKELSTVYSFLQQRGGEKLLDDKYIEVATLEILPDKDKNRSQIQREIRQKEKAVEHLKQKYNNHNLSMDEIHTCLYSICDNNSFLNSNRLPIDKVIVYLKKYFDPHTVKTGYSLAIVNGQEGSRLSHSHERQYYFALQSLTLWRDIMDDMFRLWKLAEDDILSETTTYTLKDTGQGVQRVQQSPRSYKAMTGILRNIQNSVDNWIGSSVIHMGDHNVPNALNFIDKYTQVPRILSPIVVCLENLDKNEDKGVIRLINEQYGGLDNLKMDILHDFFTSAFDGSGAETYYDAGSCIDGRLTSAWNWCQSLQSKPFYPIFKLTGFFGFDGEFK